MKLSKHVRQWVLNIGFCLTIILPVIALLSGCTLIIGSSNVNTEVAPSVSAVELAL